MKLKWLLLCFCSINFNQDSKSFSRGWISHTINSLYVQVIYENKMVHDKKFDALPHLIYVAREKHP